LARTLFVSVSKSGTTIETRSNEARIRAELQRAGLDPKRHLVAVTGEKSPMDDPEQYRAIFYMWDYVGGRYSATSMVGLVSIAFVLGLDQTELFLRGARAMDQVALISKPKDNLPLLSALLGIWNRNFLGYPHLAVI